MRKRSRLRGERSSIGRLWVMVVPAGIVLIMGIYHLRTSFILEKLDFYPGRNGTETLLGVRGTIFDRNYKELAVTLDRVSVYVDVREVDLEATAAKLSPILDVKPGFIKGLIEKERYRVWLAKNITREEEEQIVKLDLPGVYLKREQARYYPEKSTAAHVVGFVGQSMGLAGVEYRYNSLLNRFGTTSSMSTLRPVIAENRKKAASQYLVLTLDLKVQHILEKFIKDLMQQAEVESSVAILMETATGSIVAAAHHPSFDPNRFKDYSWEELTNILARPVVVPLPIKKLLWDASLLQSKHESGELLPWSLSSAKMSLGSQLRLWDRLGLYDPLNVDFIKQHATDFAQIPDTLKRALPETNYDSVVENATVLHIVAALNGLVMGGTRAFPHVINRIAAEGGKVYSLVPRTEESAVGDEVASEIRRMLRVQMTGGPLSSGYFETDTLSYINANGGRQYFHNKLFFSLIPQDKPKLMLFVFANLPPYFPSPSKTKSRLTFAGSAKKITLPMVAMQEVMSNLSDMMSVEEKSEVNFALYREIRQADVIGVGKGAQSSGTMPDLKGLSLRKSLRLLKDLKLEIQVNGTGIVVAQSPHVGRSVKYGELCQLVLQPQ